MEFKNVPAPVNCYFLLANTARDGSTPLVVPDEPVQAFEFIVSRPASPPSTPMVAPTRSFYPSHSVPDINVTHPTPSETPNSTPPTSTRSSLAGACPFSFTPSTDSESDGEGPIFFRSGGSDYNGKRPTDLELMIRDSQVVTERIDVRMSPLREDTLEEEEQLLPTTDEQCGDIVSDGMDNRAIPNGVKSQNSRKVSDASNQSYESGIESSRLSEEGDVMRKLSDSSGSEDMEYGQKRYRVGSVSKAVQFFDTWSRQRRTGLTTTVEKHGRLPSEGAIESQMFSPSAPEIIAKGTQVTVNGRPERKSD